MLINEVEYIVGLSKKSIRYYEDNGLITPSRNSDNDYRIYNDKDIEKLKKIKFLRELNVPICDIKKLDGGLLSLKDCMIERISKIQYEELNYIRIKKMCEEIIKSNENFADINITKYFQEVNILGKEGFTMRNVRTSKTKKIIGACISSIIFSLLFIFLIFSTTYFQLTNDEKIPWFMFIFLNLILAFPVLGTIYNLISRIKEILGGEEDEASKY